MIKITSSLLREIYDHTETSYPYECCGLIVGTSDGGDKMVRAFRTCLNLNTERAHDRYEMDPLCIVRAQREFKSPWDIIGFYHSHPDHPSRPSQTDTDQASPVYSYVIISVQNGTAASVQSWVLNEGEKRFFEEPLVVVEGEEK